ncbi:hypothetical protein [Nocardioides sp. T2.26MG-1]|uniref:hypothetical protein n=1 Tax=Nocardioides sp. T2.26MG-1 TaxID=3041166 RepID=UPI002477A9E2|nr:hypothetical protein [Nocardioides sp. T2.26MG-1]CAI9415455.1 hypothetical protein HIDPHFAB_02525 [Nocardioides sp. T2.26MG-1]
MDLRLMSRLAVVLAAGALVAWLAALFVGLSSGSPTAAVVLRTVLTIVVLVLLTRIVMRRAYGEPGLLGRVAVTAALAYAISPAAWAGRALVAQLFLDPGIATVILDLVLWVAVVVAAGQSADTRTASPTAAPYQLS